MERGFEIEILCQRIIDQTVEIGAAELLPKQRRVLLRGADAGDVTPAGGQRHLGPLVIGC